MVSKVSFIFRVINNYAYYLNIHDRPKRQLSQSLKSQLSRHRHIKPAAAISDPHPEHRGYYLVAEGCVSYYSPTLSLYTSARRSCPTGHLFWKVGIWA